MGLGTLPVRQVHDGSDVMASKHSMRNMLATFPVDVFSIFLTFVYFCAYVSLYMCVATYHGTVCGEERNICRHWFSASTMGVLEIVCRS